MQRRTFLAMLGSSALIPLLPAGVARSTAPWGLQTEVGSFSTSYLSTFSRASTATYFNADGKILTVGPNVPRYHDGALMIEKRATNYAA